MSIRIGPDGTIIKDDDVPSRDVPTPTPREIIRRTLNDTRSEYEQQIIQLLRSNTTAAEAQLQRDHALGNTEATYLLGKLYFDRIYAAPDYARSISLWEQGASLGDQNCKRGLADAYYFGRGREENDARAYSMYNELLANNPSDYTSMGMIGKMTAYGWGVSKNINKGLQLLEEAWRGGYARAADEIGAIYESQLERNVENIMTAYKWYQRGVDRDVPRCYYHFARPHITGDYGFDKDEQLGYEYMMHAIEDVDALVFLLLSNKSDYLTNEDIQVIMSAAERRAGYGITALQYWLAVAYDDGRDCAPNAEKAIFWYERAIENGEYDAAWRLGWNYKRGKEGFPQDFQLAFKYYKIGADADHEKCLESLGSLLDDEYIHGLSYEEKERLQRYCTERRAQKGDIYAISQLGTAYMNGYRPFEEDKEKAIQLFETTLGDSHVDHSVDLVRLYIELQKVSKYNQIVPLLNKAKTKYAGSDYLLGMVEHLFGIIYRDGIGVNRDLGTAHGYFLSASNKGYTPANEDLKHFKKGLFGWKLI